MIIKNMSRHAAMSTYKTLEHMLTIRIELRFKMKQYVMETEKN